MRIARVATVTTAAILAAFTIACGSSSSGPGSPAPADKESDPKNDVSVTACKKGNFDTLDITVTVRNSTGKQASYVITAEGLDAGGVRLGEANGAANSIAKGGSATVKLLGNVDGKGVLKTCRVASVDRF